ncbi:hypothetical protein BGW80DRAFT_1183112, partial [Lactifluus volemus]
IVPYNPFLLFKYNCHINVEYLVSFTSTKYITKYIYKGPDCVTILLIRGDEIKQYLSSKYISSAEAGSYCNFPYTSKFPILSAYSFTFLDSTWLFLTLLNLLNRLWRGVEYNAHSVLCYQCLS